MHIKYISLLSQSCQFPEVHKGKRNPRHRHLLWEQVHKPHSITHYDVESRFWLCFAISACYSQEQIQHVSTGTLCQGRACGSENSMRNCPFHSEALTEPRDNPREVVELREATLILPNMLVV